MRKIISKYILQQGQPSPIDLLDFRIMRSLKLEGVLKQNPDPPEIDPSSTVGGYLWAVHIMNGGKFHAFPLNSFLCIVAFLKRLKGFNCLVVRNKVYGELMLFLARGTNPYASRKFPTFMDSPVSKWDLISVGKVLGLNSIKFLVCSNPEMKEWMRLGYDINTPAGLISKFLNEGIYTSWREIHPNLRFNLDIYESLLSRNIIASDRVFRDIPILLSKGLLKDDDLVDKVIKVLQKGSTNPFLIFNLRGLEGLPSKIKEVIVPLSFRLPSKIKSVKVEMPMSERTIQKTCLLLKQVPKSSDTEIFLGKENITQLVHKLNYDQLNDFLLKHKKSIHARIPETSRETLYLASELKFQIPSNKKSLAVALNGHSRKVYNSAQLHMDVIGANNRLITFIQEYFRGKLPE